MLDWSYSSLQSEMKQSEMTINQALKPNIHIPASTIKHTKFYYIYKLLKWINKTKDTTMAQPCSSLWSVTLHASEIDVYYSFICIIGYQHWRLYLNIRILHKIHFKRDAAWFIEFIKLPALKLSSMSGYIKCLILIFYVRLNVEFRGEPFFSPIFGSLPQGSSWCVESLAKAVQLIKSQTTESLS